MGRRKVVAVIGDNSLEDDGEGGGGLHKQQVAQDVSCLTRCGVCSCLYCSEPLHSHTGKVPVVCTQAACKAWLVPCNYKGFINPTKPSPKLRQTTCCDACWWFFGALRAGLLLAS